MFRTKSMCQIDKAPVIRLEVQIALCCEHRVTRSFCSKLVDNQCAPAVGICNDLRPTNVHPPEWFFAQFLVARVWERRIPCPGPLTWAVSTSSAQPIFHCPNTEPAHPTKKPRGLRPRGFCVRFSLAPRVGLEPTTYGLTVRCSTD